MAQHRQIRTENPNYSPVVHVLDAQSGEALYDLNHVDRVWSVAVSLDNQRIATGCRDTAARLWDTQTGALIKVFMATGDGSPAHYGYVWSVAFSPDGELVATGGYDGNVRLWSVASGAQTACFQLGPLSNQSPPGLVVRFSADGQEVFGKPAGIDEERTWAVPSPDVSA